MMPCRTDSPTENEEQPKTALRALPASWYTSQELYELERRAIFSRKWQLITHKARLHQNGDWLKYEIAGYPFVLARNSSGDIVGFHNVCRHRAFPVVTAEQGNNRVLTCKYHGWSYTVGGKLTKAPGYQDLPEFKKENNSLFPVHVHVDNNGFIWVNLDNKTPPENSWEEDTGGIDKQERYKEYNFEDYVFDHVWQMDGDYNWKILADNYNECYHCTTSHPDIGSLANLQSYSVETRDGNIVHDPATTEEQRANGLVIASTYYFPNVSTNVSPHFFMIQRFLPHSATSSTMRYEVYRNKNSSEAKFQLVNSIYKRIMAEDKDLCAQAQRNLNAGIFINGEMHPKMEKGPLYFQKTVRDTVLEHYAREKDHGDEIWPARQQLPSTAKVSKEDIEFCSSLACEESPLEQLVW